MSQSQTWYYEPPRVTDSVRISSPRKQKQQSGAVAHGAPPERSTTGTENAARPTAVG